MPSKVTKKKATKKKAAKKPTAKKVIKKKTSKKKTSKKKQSTNKTAVKKKTSTEITKKSSKNKTVANSTSVAAFLKKAPAKYHEDCEALIEIMSSITKQPATMWGPSIIGFGSYHYVYDSGREGDMPLTGFSPRASALSLYIMSGFDGAPELMANLGKYKNGKSCLYIKSLDDVHVPTLKMLIRQSVKVVKARG